jgi:hypothetical protein
LRLLDGSSVKNLRVVKVSTKATVEVLLPVEVQLSAKPLSGKFRIKCTSSTDPAYVQYSSAIQTHNNPSTVLHRIFQGCGTYQDKINIHDLHNFKYRENGYGFILEFYGMNEKPG